MKRNIFFMIQGDRTQDRIMKGRPHGRPFIIPVAALLSRFMCAVFFVLSTNAIQAQRKLALGLEGGIPLGEFADQGSMLFGPVAGLDLPAARSFALTLRAGYAHVVPQGDFSDHFETWYMVPVQAGLKFFLMQQQQQQGFYLHGQAGMHLVAYRTNDVPAGPAVIPGERSSEAFFSYALGAGAQLPRWDMGLRINAIAPPGDAPEGARASIYLGAGLAYLFTL